MTMARGVFMQDLPAIVPAQPIRDAVYEKLKDAILSGSFDNGARLVESDLAAQLQVSRTPVREALRRLESEGILEARLKQGLVVKEYTPDEIREIYLIREALESLAAAHAVRNASEEDIAQLEMITREMLEVADDPKEVFEIHRRFSETLNRASHMPTLVGIIESLRDQISRFRRVSLRSEERKEQARAEHFLLLEALKERDEEKIVTLTRSHIRGALDAFFDTKTGKEGR